MIDKTYNLLLSTNHYSITEHLAFFVVPVFHFSNLSLKRGVLNKNDELLAMIHLMEHAAV